MTVYPKWSIDRLLDATLSIKISRLLKLPLIHSQVPSRRSQTNIANEFFQSTNQQMLDDWQFQVKFQVNFEQGHYISTTGRFKTPDEIDENHPSKFESRRANYRSKTHDKSVFYCFCRWRLRGRGTRDRRRRWNFRRARRGRKRSERIRPPFASAVVKKAKSDRLSLPIIKTARRIKRPFLRPRREESWSRGPRARAYASNKPRREAEGIHEDGGGKKKRKTTRTTAIHRTRNRARHFIFRWYFRGNFPSFRAFIFTVGHSGREGSTFRHSASD